MTDSTEDELLNPPTHRQNDSAPPTVDLLEWSRMRLPDRRKKWREYRRDYILACTRRFYVTFPEKYATQTHPELGRNKRLPLGWIVVWALGMSDAWVKANYTLGRRRFSPIMDEEEFQAKLNENPDRWPAGELGVITPLIANPGTFEDLFKTDNNPAWKEV